MTKAGAHSVRAALAALLVVLVCTVAAARANADHQLMPVDEEGDETTCLWDEADQPEAFMTEDDGAAAAAAALVSDPVCGGESADAAIPKRKLTADVVTEALLRLAARTPLASSSHHQPPVKRPLLQGPSLVRTAAQRQEKVEELRGLRDGLLQDRQLRGAVEQRDALLATGGQVEIGCSE